MKARSETLKYNKQKDLKLGSSHCAGTGGTKNRVNVEVETEQAAVAIEPAAKGRKASKMSLAPLMVKTLQSAKRLFRT